MPRVAIIGDSNIGGSADGRGTLGRALLGFLGERGITDVSIVGVSSSTLGQWIVKRPEFPDGLPANSRYGRGIYNPFRRLGRLDRAATDLRHVKAFNPDLVIVNFASNDAAGYGGGNPKAYVDNILWLQDYLGKPMVFFDGGFATRTEGRKRPMVNFAKPLLESRRFTFIDASTPERRAPFERSGAHPHPPVRTWTEYLHQPSIERALDAALRGRRIPWGLVAAVVGGVAAGFFLLG